MKHKNYKNILKGVSTLDLMKKNIKIVLFLILLTAFSANMFGRGGHSTLDVVDPNLTRKFRRIHTAIKSWKRFKYCRMERFWHSEISILIIACRSENWFVLMPTVRSTRPLTTKP